MSKESIYSQLRAGTLTPVEVLTDAGITDANKYDLDSLADILISFGDFRDEKSRLKLTKTQAGWIHAVAILLKELSSEKRKKKREWCVIYDEEDKVSARETRSSKKRRFRHNPTCDHDTILERPIAAISDEKVPTIKCTSKSTRGNLSLDPEKLDTEEKEAIIALQEMVNKQHPVLSRAIMYEYPNVDDVWPTHLNPTSQTERTVQSSLSYRNGSARDASSALISAITSKQLSCSQIPTPTLKDDTTSLSWLEYKESPFQMRWYWSNRTRKPAQPPTSMIRSVVRGTRPPSAG